MKKILLFLFSFPVFCSADISSRLNIATQDGTVNTWPYKAKFTNGTVTDNGDGTVSITSGGGSAGLPLPQGATNYIQNINTLQSGATAYPDFLYVGSTVSISGSFTAGRISGTDYFSFDRTTGRTRLVNGSASLSTSIPLILWNNNTIVGAYTGVGFAVGASSVPTAYWYLDNVNSRLAMADGSGNVACYFDTTTRNLHCNYGIETSTAVLTASLKLTTGAITAEDLPFSVSAIDNFRTYNASLGSALSAAYVFKSSITNPSTQVGAAPFFADNWISLSGSPVVAIGAFQGVSTVQPTDTAAYTALGGISNVAGGTMLGQYMGMGSMPVITGAIGTVVKKGTGTVTEMNAGLFQVQNTSTTTTSRGYALHVLKPTGIAGSVITDSVGVQVDTQTTVLGSQTNTYAFRSQGIDDQVAFSGHLVTTGGLPTISACGAAPSGSVVGTDKGGTITVGGGVVTACTLTFNRTYGSAPDCTYSDNSTAIAVGQTAISATAFTIGTSASLGGGLVMYNCSCNQTGCK